MVRRAIPPLTAEEIYKVARAAFEVIQGQGFDVCLFGSAACNMYGMNGRMANDVDIIVLGAKWSLEDLKEMLVWGDKNFFRKPARDPMNNWTTLWYRIPSPTRRRKCKVDVLKPRKMGVPKIPANVLYTTPLYDDIPLLPLIPLLLLKLLGWSARKMKTDAHVLEKVPIDEQDILELLDIAVSRPDIGHLSSERWMSRWFKRKARIQVDQFLQIYPPTLCKWRALGFRISGVHVPQTTQIITVGELLIGYDPAPKPCSRVKGQKLIKMLNMYKPHNGRELPNPCRLREGKLLGGEELGKGHRLLEEEELKGCIPIEGCRLLRLISWTLA